MPQFLIDSSSDTPKLIKTKRIIKEFIMKICPWLPDDIFDRIDVCENAILLTQKAHSEFGAFKWFVVMDTVDGKSVYKAMQVEEDGLLDHNWLCRWTALENGLYNKLSSYNQTLFIGGMYPRPDQANVRFHEFLARIFHLRGHPEYYNYDSDDELEFDWIYDKYGGNIKYDSLASDIQ